MKWICRLYLQYIRLDFHMIDQLAWDLTIHTLSRRRTERRQITENLIPSLASCVRICCFVATRTKTISQLIIKSTLSVGFLFFFFFLCKCSVIISCEYSNIEMTIYTSYHLCTVVINIALVLPSIWRHAICMVYPAVSDDPLNMNCWIMNGSLLLSDQGLRVAAPIAYKNHRISVTAAHIASLGTLRSF